MKKIIKSLSLLALLPALSLGVTSCDSGSKNVKDVKAAAQVLGESITATPTVYKQKAEKSDFFSLEANSSVNVTSKTFKKTADVNAQLVVNPKFITELTNEEPNLENVSLVDSMYAGATLYSKDDLEEFTSVIEIGVYEDVAYGHTKTTSSDEENNSETKEKMVGVNDWLLTCLGYGEVSYVIDEEIPEVGYLTLLESAGTATIAWLCEEIDTETYVNTVGTMICEADPEIKTEFETFKPLIVNIADVARTNINKLFTITGTDESFSISNNTQKTKDFLNSIVSYLDEQSKKTEGTEAMLAPLYAQISKILTDAVKNVPTYSVTLSLSFKDKAVVGFGYDVSFSNEEISVKSTLSFKLSFEKITVHQMTGLNEYKEPETVTLA